MIVRLILLVAVVFAVLWLLKQLFREDTGAKGKAKLKTENMRQCKFCGTHVPESLLVVSKDQPYCCQDHADRDQP